ncbi:low temperature requirement protein A [Micromonospora sp. MS34]|uniref:low temperature requirement protein A n=1 Tax=Micromonospora sp. MS34 TaxID=3385971 RepID=UPI0039A07578
MAPSPTATGRPTLRTRERGHRQAAWSELFYDLVFVVIVSQIAQSIVDDPGWSSLARAGTWFVIAWWAWVNEVFYTTRFDNDTDRARRFIGTLQLIALTLLAASIARNGSNDVRAIAGAYALVRTVQVVELWRASHYVPEARPLTHYFVRANGAAVVLWWVGVTLPEPWSFWLWGAGLAVGLVAGVAARCMSGPVLRRSARACSAARRAGPKTRRISVDGRAATAGIGFR